MSATTRSKRPNPQTIKRPIRYLHVSTRPPEKAPEISAVAVRVFKGISAKSNKGKNQRTGRLRRARLAKERSDTKVDA